MPAVRHHLPASLLQAATAPYHQAGLFAREFARGKLRGDPVFAGLLAHGWIVPRSRILDLGCGQGLLASVLLASEKVAAQGGWPPDWPAAPVACSVRGIELMPKDVARAQAALAGYGERAQIEQGDIAQADFGQPDVVVILDVLHYMPSDTQVDVLRRVQHCLPPGGRLLLRVGDKAAGLPHRLSNWVDRLVFLARGHASGKVYCHTLAEWQQRLHALGFAVQTWPMDAGTPFSSILLVADKAASPQQEQR